MNYIIFNFFHEVVSDTTFKNEKRNLSGAKVQTPFLNMLPIKMMMILKDFKLHKSLLTQL